MSASVRPMGQLLKWLRGGDKTAGTDQAAAHTVPAGDQPPEVVFETSHPLEAEVVRGMLECHDIPAMIQREPVSQAYPFTVGDLAACRILVPGALAEDARGLVAASREEEGRTDPAGLEAQQARQGSDA